MKYKKVIWFIAMVRLFSVWAQVQVPNLYSLPLQSPLLDFIQVVAVSHPSGFLMTPHTPTPATVIDDPVMQDYHFNHPQLQTPFPPGPVPVGQVAFHTALIWSYAGEGAP